MQEHTETGQWLAKGDTVVTLADLLDEVHVIANVDQRDLANVQIGAKVSVHVEGVVKQEWPGVVEAIIPRSEWATGSRSFPVKIVVKNDTLTIDGRVQPLLTEGMLAHVTFSDLNVSDTHPQECDHPHCERREDLPDAARRTALNRQGEAGLVAGGNELWRVGRSARG